MKATTIKPGILVSLKSTVSGGVTYSRRDLDAPNTVPENGAKVERWETVREVLDPEERERADKVRSKAVALIRRVCYATAFGLICPLDQEANLDAAIAEGRRLTIEFRQGAKFTYVSLFALKGHIASTDEEAARAIGDEVTGLINGMSSAIDRLDVEAIREAATKAKDLGALLSDEQAETVSEAVKAARKAARQIVARVQKDGESAAVVLKDIQRGALKKARIAFLDVDDVAPVAGEALPAVNVQRVAELDIDEVQ